MPVYQESIKVLESLFARDSFFAFATSKDNVPSVRIVDAFYDDYCFYIVVSGRTQKIREIALNENVALCHEMYRFTGKAYNIGHPLHPENQEIRSKLIKVFEPWYFAHNNEDSNEMYYIKVELVTGFFHKDGTGYRVDFINKSAESMPFEFGE